MMYYGTYCGAPFYGIIGLLVNLLIAVIVISIIVRIFRRHGSEWKGGLKGMWPGHSAEEMLRERFAKGDISKEEYEEKLKVLRS